MEQVGEVNFGIFVAFDLRLRRTYEMESTRFRKKKKDSIRPQRQGMGSPTASTGEGEE